LKLVVFLVTLFFLPLAEAQTYPTKPIRLVVPFAPGGSSTLVARSIAVEMEKGLGQSIVVENKGGGGGSLAMSDVARADPDGYTLIIGHVGSLAMTPFMTANLG
jgi:tripartite-type tricarboxylate transporter receptor subunit TctC